jgi:hypothetical protein
MGGYSSENLANVSCSKMIESNIYYELQPLRETLAITGEELEYKTIDVDKSYPQDLTYQNQTVCVKTGGTDGLPCRPNINHDGCLNELEMHRIERRDTTEPIYNEVCQSFLPETSRALKSFRKIAYLLIGLFCIICTILAFFCYLLLTRINQFGKEFVF